MATRPVSMALRKELMSMSERTEGTKAAARRTKRKRGPVLSIRRRLPWLLRKSRGTGTTSPT
jgi:hypothetical protein